MKKLSFILLSFFLSSFAYSQDKIININTKNIEVPEVYDFGKISDNTYTQYVLKNNRNSAVVVSEITTPPGFFANISNKTIAPHKKSIVYVGLSPKATNFDDDFEAEIVIKTNLVTDIKIKLKGTIDTDTENK